MDEPRWTRNQRMGVAAAVASLLLASIAGAAGIAVATDHPTFCGSACHEMGPYYDAWSAGSHAEIACVECHVDAGAISRITHKAEAAREAWVHLVGEPAFPLEDPQPIPDERCTACHERVRVGSPGFDHVEHAEQGPCESCHRDTGHDVTVAALRQAGILRTGASRAVDASSAIAVVDHGRANVEGHVDEPCSRCHDLEATGCESCHETDHEGLGTARKDGDCLACHTAGPSFAFHHPDQASGCGACHDAPGEHRFEESCETCHDGSEAWQFVHRVEVTCTQCHPTPAGHRKGSCETCHELGASWAFTHPSPSSTCTECHARPAQHSTRTCPTCHRTGESWAFVHPGSRDCNDCHSRPAGHRSGSCTRCHASSSSWAFKHPGSLSTCTSCHSRPGGHRSGSCARCHSTGSWAFRHPGSKSCSSCHRAPSGHYGSSCASCHSPGRAWRSASFSHPRIPGGEHSYRSFACSSCHPRGYGSYACTRCHSSNEGGEGGDHDDDDDD